MNKDAAGRYIGLAAASRSLVCGCELALNAMRKSPDKIYLMLLASDASERTAKQTRDKCAYYQTELISTDMTMEEISRYAGKSGLVSVCAVTNKGLADKIREELSR